MQSKEWDYIHEALSSMLVWEIQFNLSTLNAFPHPQVFSQYEIILRLQQTDSKMLLKCIPHV